MLLIYALAGFSVTGILPTNVYILNMGHVLSMTHTD